MHPGRRGGADAAGPYARSRVQDRSGRSLPVRIIRYTYKEPDENENKLSLNPLCIYFDYGNYFNRAPPNPPTIATVSGCQFRLVRGPLLVDGMVQGVESFHTLHTQPLHKSGLAFFARETSPTAFGRSYPSAAGSQKSWSRSSFSGCAQIKRLAQKTKCLDLGTRPSSIFFLPLLRFWLPVPHACERRYPCQNQGARSVSASGHSTAASRVRFNADGGVLLSIGSDSRVVLQHLVLPPLPPV